VSLSQIHTPSARALPIQAETTNQPASGASFADLPLDWENAYATSYHVDVSVDAKHWSTVFRTVTGKGGVRDIPVRPTPARYVRMYGTERNTQYGYSLKEFEVR